MSKTPLSATTKPAAKQYDPDNDKQYTPQQLEAFLDSVGHLPTKPLADKVAFYADSVFKSQKQMDTIISPADMTILKHAIRKGVMAVSTARRIFRNKDIDSACNEKDIFLTYKPGLIPVVFYPFDKNKNDFNEYAICIGDPGHCPNAALYFFKGNKIIALQDGYNRFGTDDGHYKDTDGKTVFYRVQEFAEGSGVGWFNYFFYKYDGDKLIPVLNELQNGNVQGPLGTRVIWLESTILKTNPLTIKMVYSQFGMKDDATIPRESLIINDSTIVQYLWDEHTKTLQGQYAKSKISKARILSYYLEHNDFLFMNSYYSTLKAALRDKAKSKLILEYLNKVKNIYCGQQ
ncbi:hypothetical protein [uncultured Mucilaginibacter sp.]|uniref:hypothetical protein n=1 Tax=uncultured Mucilaginibacter sp. TaxID=797541 RepID=UPI0025DFF334|nr:hypothetical protein [uncultured Mucilaginibacter sp.]